MTVTDARAQVTALEAEIDNTVRFAHARVDAARSIATQFVKFLNPAQAIIVARQQQRENFMFIGQFELLLAKQQQYDAYQSYLEAVRDYWLARSELARATGGSLPSDAQMPSADIGVDAVMNPSEQSMGDMPGMKGMDHSGQHAHGETPHPETNTPQDPSTMPGEHLMPKQIPPAPGAHP